MSIESMKQVLKDIVKIPTLTHGVVVKLSDVERALEEVEKQDHVGVFREDDDVGHVDLVPHRQLKLKDGDKLYRSPLPVAEPHKRPSRSDIKPLSDEEIEAIWPLRPTDEIVAFARAIEAAHGIKGEE